MRTKFLNKDVAEKYRSIPKSIQNKLLDLRELIFQVALKTEGVGKLEEALKWGDPSFITSETNSGSLIRINHTKDPTKYAMYFLCQTSLVKIFREIYPNSFEFEGNRALIFDTKKKIPTKKLEHCIAMALTYKKSKYRL